MIRAPHSRRGASSNNSGATNAVQHTIQTARAVANTNNNNNIHSTDQRSRLTARANLPSLDAATALASASATQSDPSVVGNDGEAETIIASHNAALHPPPKNSNKYVPNSRLYRPRAKDEGAGRVRTLSEAVRKHNFRDINRFDGPAFQVDRIANMPARDLATLALAGNANRHRSVYHPTASRAPPPLLVENNQASPTRYIPDLNRARELQIIAAQPMGHTNSNSNSPAKHNNNNNNNNNTARRALGVLATTAAESSESASSPRARVSPSSGHAPLPPLVGANAGNANSIVTPPSKVQIQYPPVKTKPLDPSSLPPFSAKPSKQPDGNNNLPGYGRSLAATESMSKMQTDAARKAASDLAVDDKKDKSNNSITPVVDNNNNNNSNNKSSTETAPASLSAVAAPAPDAAAGSVKNKKNTLGRLNKTHEAELSQNAGAVVAVVSQSSSVSVVAAAAVSGNNNSGKKSTSADVAQDDVKNASSDVIAAAMAQSGMARSMERDAGGNAETEQQQQQQVPTAGVAHTTSSVGQQGQAEEVGGEEEEEEKEKEEAAAEGDGEEEAENDDSLPTPLDVARGILKLHTGRNLIMESSSIGSPSDDDLARIEKTKREVARMKQKVARMIQRCAVGRENGQIDLAADDAQDAESFADEKPIEVAQAVFEALFEEGDATEGNTELVGAFFDHLSETLGLAQLLIDRGIYTVAAFDGNLSYISLMFETIFQPAVVLASAAAAAAPSDDNNEEANDESSLSKNNNNNNNFDQLDFVDLFQNAMFSQSRRMPMARRLLQILNVNKTSRMSAVGQSGASIDDSSNTDDKNKSKLDVVLEESADAVRDFFNEICSKAKQIPKEDVSCRMALIQEMLQDAAVSAVLQVGTHEMGDSHTVFSRAAKEGDVELMKLLLANCGRTTRAAETTSADGEEGAAPASHDDAAMNNNNNNDDNSEKSNIVVVTGIDKLQMAQGDKQQMTTGVMLLQRAQQQQQQQSSSLVFHEENKIDINRISTGDKLTALIHAVLADEPQAVEYLLSLPGIDVKYKSENGNALFFATNLRRDAKIVAALQAKQ